MRYTSINGAVVGLVDEVKMIDNTGGNRIVAQAFA